MQIDQNPPFEEVIPLADFGNFSDSANSRDYYDWFRQAEHVHNKGVCIKSKYPCPSQAKPSDIFGQPISVGDYISAGMAYGRSSVLRVGRILKIAQPATQVKSGYRVDEWSVKVQWTHNGGPTGRLWDVKDSSIKWDSTYSYAKFMKVPPEYVEQFREDIERK